MTIKILKPNIFKVRHLANYQPLEFNNPYNFLKELDKIFQMPLNILPKLWVTLCCHQQKIQKMSSHFWRVYDHNFGSKHDNQTNDPIFLFVLWALSFGIFHFRISKPSKFSSMGPPFAYVLVCKIHIYMLKMSLSRLST